MAVAKAVSNQVHVSIVRHALYHDILETAYRSHKIQSDILNQIEVASRSRTVSYQTLVRERMNMIVAEARYDIAYADVQSAFAMIYTSIGYDPYGPDITGQEDIETLASSLQQLWSSREESLSNTNQG